MRTFTLTLALLLTSALALAQGTYTQVDFPAAIYTQGYAINSAGEVVGVYQDALNGFHGFLLSDGMYTTIDFPGETETLAYGINDAGQIVGATAGSTIGFLYDRSNDTFTTIQAPADVTQTVPLGINNQGQIVGFVEKHNHNTFYSVGFILDSGTFRGVLPQGYPFSGLCGINNLGVAVGEAYTPELRTRNFAYNGNFRKIIIPTREPFAATAINDLGFIVGDYFPQGGSEAAGFILTPAGEFQTLVFPGAKSTAAFGINNSGQVSGVFQGSDNLGHGFLWTPPAAPPEGH